MKVTKSQKVRNDVERQYVRWAKALTALHAADPARYDLLVAQQVERMEITDALWRVSNAINHGIGWQSQDESLPVRETWQRYKKFVERTGPPSTDFPISLLIEAGLTVGILTDPVCKEFGLLTLASYSAYREFVEKATIWLRATAAHPAMLLELEQIIYDWTPEEHRQRDRDLALQQPFLAEQHALWSHNTNPKYTVASE